MLDLPEERMLEVAEELPDDRLADALEEMPESDQVDLLNQLDDARAADVLDQMQPDDAADLIAQFSVERGEALLELMEPEEAEDVRFLLSYAPETAGGLMTTEPIIVSADATVAEGLALIRRHELAPALGAAVCVTLPPYEPPTGRFLGMVHFQRMLRYPPSERLGTLLDQNLQPVLASTSAAEVARTLASYNLVSLPVVDESHRLVGVVTIDDVLDYLLPDDWRSADHDEAEPAADPDLTTASIPMRGRRAPHGTR
jgi:Mg/Co/Ni transporter MgtE